MATTALDFLPAPLRSLRLKTKQQELLLRVSALALIYVLAFAVRLFSVLRYESMIHEFDPYFNYRTTLFLSENGFSEFWNWFDSESWYPLGRVVGGTLFPGLMVTAALLHRLLRALSLAVHIREVCVLTAPFFAANTTLVAYAFGREIWDSGAGLVAAALIAIVPGYISRSVAGSYDNEGVAIFALLLTFYLFVRAVNTGSLAWALASAFGYFYMVSAWGGYVFIINLVPLYVLVLLVTGRYSQRLYVAYNCMYVLGMLLAMQIRFVGFQHVQSGEHMAAMGVFFLLQVFFFLDWVKYLLNDARLFKSFLRITLTCVITVGPWLLELVLHLVTSPLGRGGFTPFLILPMQKTIYQSLRLSLSISQQHGHHSCLISTSSFSCFQLASISVSSACQMPRYLLLCMASRVCTLLE